MFLIQSTGVTQQTSVRLSHNYRKMLNMETCCFMKGLNPYWVLTS